MTHLRFSLAVLSLCLIGSNALAQTKYPVTVYQGFGGANDFATSPPDKLDPGPKSDARRSMSPDSWNAPLTGADGLSEFQPGSTKSTPNIPEFDSSKTFQRAAIGPGEIPTPNSMRYPLDGAVQPPQPTPSNRPNAPAVPGEFENIDQWYGASAQPPTQFDQFGGVGPGAPPYRPDLGHRGASATQRHFGSLDQGEKFDFEDKKKQYPPMKEILATGRYFGSAEALYLKGSFQGNTAIATAGAGIGSAIPFDFDYEIAPAFRLGFESKYGPGVELDYWQYDETSNVASFTSDGTTTGSTSTWMMGVNSWSRLEALNAGERLDVSHTIDVEVIGASFFKEIKFKISRLNGMFGLQYASITQSMNATLNSGGSTIGQLNSRTDMQAFGPKFAMEYYRPVGHTKLEFITSAGGSVMFGKRDQYLQNTVQGDSSRIGADEFVTMIDFLTGVQYKKMTAENRNLYARVGMTYQAWIGGGTGLNPQDDFGLRGFTFAVGYNR